MTLPSRGGLIRGDDGSELVVVTQLLRGQLAGPDAGNRSGCVRRPSVVVSRKKPWVSMPAICRPFSLEIDVAGQDSADQKP